MPTPYRIDEAKWDEVKQRVRNGCVNKHKQTASEINTNLLRQYTIVQDLFKGFEMRETMPTQTDLKKRLGFKRYKSKKPTQDTIASDLVQIPFWEVFVRFLNESGEQNNWTKSTYEKFAAMKNHLLRCFGEDISFDTFSEQGLYELVNHLSNGEDMRNSTIGKQISFLKWFLRWSFQKGYNKNKAYEAFRPKLKSTQKKVIFLTREELEKLKSCEIPVNKKYLERVRDVFLFSCFTGLRYSDVYNLKKSDVKEDHIEVTTVKTADSLVIELNKHSKAILDKYADETFQGDAALPVISNQRMNTYLKELGELAGIDDPVRETNYKGNKRIDTVWPKYHLLGTHAGRRTFICNALSLGIPAQVVMKWTGHSDYKAMKPYIDVADEIKVDAMSKFNQF